MGGRHEADSGMLDLSGGEYAEESSTAVGQEGEVLGEYRRVDNITDATLRSYQAAYGPEVTKTDVFYYMYALLYSPEYRTRYGADLKKVVTSYPAGGEPGGLRRLHHGWPRSCRPAPGLRVREAHAIEPRCRWPGCALGSAGDNLPEPAAGGDDALCPGAPGRPAGR